MLLYIRLDLEAPLYKGADLAPVSEPKTTTPRFISASAKNVTKIDSISGATCLHHSFRSLEFLSACLADSTAFRAAAVC